MQQGMIFNIQRFSIHDGPGIRTTVFLKGCPLNCRWCSNPESKSRHRELLYNPRNCKRCHSCVAVCPEHAISVREDGYIQIDRNSCTRCEACTKVCLPAALYMEGRLVTVGDLMEEVLKDRAFYEKSGGGVTVSGGEPFFQPEFLLSFLRALKGAGIHTTIETTGFTAREALSHTLPFIDLLYFDLKHPDSVKHREKTDVGNERILENLAFALASGKDVVVRIPVIPGFNNTPEAVAGYMELFHTLKVRQAHLLPFHQYGAGKYDLMGLPYEYRDTPNMEKEALAGMKTSLEQAGCQVQLGG